MDRKSSPYIPPKMLAEAEKVARERRTTISAIVRRSLGEFAFPDRDLADHDPLLAFSLGKIDRHQAIEKLGCRDYATLLVALGDNDLPMPLPDPEDIERQAQTFAQLWRGEGD